MGLTKHKISPFVQNLKLKIACLFPKKIPDRNGWWRMKCLVISIPAQLFITLLSDLANHKNMLKWSIKNQFEYALNLSKIKYSKSNCLFPFFAISYSKRFLLFYSMKERKKINIIGNCKSVEASPAHKHQSKLAFFNINNPVH